MYARYAAFISDFMPMKTGSKESPYYLRNGKLVDYTLLKDKWFGLTGTYSLLDWTIDQRVPVGEEGWHIEMQGLAMIANGTSGGQLQKEEPYLDQQTEVDQITRTELTVGNRKVDANQIVVLLVAGTKLISAPMHEEQWPEEFFGVWVRSDRRR